MLKVVTSIAWIGILPMLREVSLYNAFFNTTVRMDYLNMLCHYAPKLSHIQAQHAAAS